MGSVTRLSLSHLHLHLMPPPRNVAESRAVFRAMERFGEIDMFKVLRFEETTKQLTPRAHIIYKHPDSASALLAAGAVPIPSTDIIATPSKSIFKHDQYVIYAATAHLVKNESILSQRKIVGRIEMEVDDESTRFGSDPRLGRSEQTRDMKQRLIRRYTGRFTGFNDLAEAIRKEDERKKAAEERRKKDAIEKEERERAAEERRIKEAAEKEEWRKAEEEQGIARAAEKLREENEKLARGEKIDLSGKSAEALQEDQLNTIQSILSDLDKEEIKSE